MSYPMFFQRFLSSPNVFPTILEGRTKICVQAGLRQGGTYVRTTLTPCRIIVLPETLEQRWIDSGA